MTDITHEELMRLYRLKAMPEDRASLAAEIDAKTLEEVRKKYPMDNDEKQRIARELKKRP